MTLQATGAGSGRESLDVMAKMVYQCAEKGRTIRKVMETLGLEQHMTHRIIQQLVGQGLINVLPAKIKKEELLSEGPRSPAAGPTTSSGPRLTPAYFEEIEKLYVKCKNANYYDMLSIDPDTPKNELRTRYFELSKRFHPDKVFGEVPDDVKRKMSYVFQNLTTAYDTLSNPNRRAEYNETIADELEIRAIEKKLRQAVRESVPPPSPDPEPPDPKKAGERGSVPPRSAKGSFVNPLKKNARTEERKEFVPSNAPRKIYTIRRDQIRRNMADRALKNLLARRSPTSPPPANLEKMFDTANRAVDQSQFATAIKILKSILQANPDNERAQDMLASATEANDRVQAQQHIRRGRYAKNEGRFDEAKWHYEQALSMEKDNIDARHLLAEVLIETKSDLSRAHELMKEVIVLGGQRARYYVTLGDIFLLVGEADRAQDAFKKALRLEPNNRDVMKRIK